MQMDLGRNFVNDPNSKAEPAGGAAFKLIDRDRQELVEVRARFAYLDELERIIAMRDADKFCDVQKLTDTGCRNGVRKCFLLAACLKQPHDIDVAFFKSEGQASAGEVALRKLGYPSAARLWELYNEWQAREFLTEDELEAERTLRAPTDKEQQQLEGQAAGESQPGHM